MGNKQSSSQSHEIDGRVPRTTKPNTTFLPIPNFNDDEPIPQHQLNPVQNIPDSLAQEPLLDISLQLKRTLIQSSSFNEQVLPMVVSLKTKYVESAARAPLDLVCVIDQSGSMEGEKIELVKKAFGSLLNYLEENDRISIVLFDNVATRLIPLMRTTAENKTKIMEQVHTIKPWSCTNIELGMKYAFQILNQRKHKNPVSSIFLLSDGKDNLAQDRVRESLYSMKVAQEITIHTFGFGKDHDAQLMSDIADHRDGNFYAIDQLSMIDEAFIDCLGGLLSVAAQNVNVKVIPVDSEQLQGVKLAKAYGYAGMWNKEGEVYSTRIAMLTSGMTKDFVLELAIPVNKKELKDDEKNVIVCNAEISFTTLTGVEMTQKGSLTITLLNEGEDYEEEKDNKEVMMNLFRVKGATLMQEARLLAEQEKAEEGLKMMVNFKEELENSLLKDEVFIKNLVKDIEQSIKFLEPRTYPHFGKEHFIGCCRAQMNQKSNLNSANAYQNTLQKKMLADLRQKKSAE